MVKVTLRRVTTDEEVGHLALAGVPQIADDVVDGDGNVWVVKRRQWHTGGAVTLLVTR